MIQMNNAQIHPLQVESVTITKDFSDDSNGDTILSGNYQIERINMEDNTLILFVNVRDHRGINDTRKMVLDPNTEDSNITVNTSSNN